MTSQDISGAEFQTSIDKQILSLQRSRRRLMFSELARALPAYTWHMLFTALGRLHKRHCVDLLAHQWDYEIIFLEDSSSKQSLARSPQQCDQSDRHERTHV